ncbi:hypothetical protein [Roseivivax sediminis]|uniref:DUF3108 domain-containing protein n=1 Tax=Roseivivax sediminis TaxID=936889 RepID=A0A1I1U092_9RHOB|nr:hypothetical protein [Roseivivax sediminis]SFD63028.1 hypothetical protein SAMN04515678_10217 [Roseivivax sediminis]
MPRILALIGFLAAASAAGAEPAASYDLLFKNGTLDEISREATLVYDRHVENSAKADAALRDTGRIALTFGEDQGVEIATLEFRQGDKYRTLGRFPASVGNPMIMYFYETVVRDMAETAGGSPFYIRNRVKEAMARPGNVTEGTAEWQGDEVAATTVTLTPFTEDPNRSEMAGFADLALTVTMSEEVPGWYLSLSAEAPGEGEAPLYASQMRLQEIDRAAEAEQ